MRVTRLVLCCLLVAGLARATGQTNLFRKQRVDISSETHSEHVLRLTPGSLYAWHGITFRVPQPGHEVSAVADFVGRGAVLFGATTSANGVVTIRDDSTAPGLRLMATAATNPCKDSAYNLTGNRWGSDFRWYFLASSTPKGIYWSSAAASFRRAVGHITGDYNNCGYGDNVSATNTYLGYTSLPQNVTSSASCLTGDGVNVVGFGSLPSGFLGLTCWWSMNGTITESDMTLNRGYHWYVNLPSGCVSKWNIEGVATHEFGHAFGLAHVSETYHPTLTMSTTIRSCQNSEITLGLGDVSGLNALY